jgi:hypothetical protein
MRAVGFLLASESAPLGFYCDQAFVGFCQSNGRSLMSDVAPRPKRPLRCEDAPLGQRAGSSLFVNLAGDEMALLIEMVVDLGVN